ncbi:MAG: YihY/virulence factor BrkB family protein [Streptomycetales bacterium]
MLAGTVGSCFRYRVTGLAAEAAFFALLSLPPLLLGLVGTFGYLDGLLGVETIQSVRQTILDAASTVLSGDTVNQVLSPTVQDVLTTGRADIISIGFLIALWSGSRALNVYVDTITVAYGRGGIRGIVQTRLLSFSLYLVGVVLGVVLLPLVVAGPTLVSLALPEPLEFMRAFYWPVVVVLSVAFLTTLYHLAVPVRTPWIEDLPGAIFALLIWIGGSALLRLYLTSTVSGATAVYGSLAAPVAMLLWLYVTALAVLIGAALNAEVEKTWPPRRSRAAPQDPAGHPANGDVIPLDERASPGDPEGTQEREEG